MRIFLLLVAMMCSMSSSLLASPLHDAAKKGDVDAIATALAAGADVDEKDGSSTPLYVAVKRGHYAAAALLVARGANANATHDLRGPLLLVAADQDRSDLIELLVTHRAAPGATREGETALHVAARRGCLACVEALVEAGADVNAVTADGYARTPLHLAKVFEHRAVADYITEHGAVIPVPERISDILPSADLAKGRALFEAQCRPCHDIAPMTSGLRGPTLWNVVGRDKASIPGQKYSPVLLSLPGSWNYEELNGWIYGPTLTQPGVFMEVTGVADTKDRANLVAYLRTLGDRPPPLP